MEISGSECSVFERLGFEETNEEDIRLAKLFEEFESLEFFKPQEQQKEKIIHVINSKLEGIDSFEDKQEVQIVKFMAPILNNSNNKPKEIHPKVLDHEFRFIVPIEIEEFSDSNSSFDSTSSIESESESEEETSEIGSNMNEQEKWRCNICFEDFNTKRNLVECSKEHKFCETCIRSYLELSLKENNNGMPKCPLHSECQTVFGTSLASRVLSLSQIEELMGKRVGVSVRDGSIVVRCNNPNCMSIIQVSLSNQNQNQNQKITQIQCDECSHIMTLASKDQKELKKFLKKKMPQSDFGSRLNAFYLVKNTKPCPYCKSQIEKNGGCPVMTCFKCSKRFCWNCGDTMRYSSFYWTGKHHQKYQLNGCRCLLFPQNTFLRVTTRSTLFIGKVTGIVVLGPPVAIGAGLVVGLPYLSYRLVKKCVNVCL